jgi:transposase
MLTVEEYGRIRRAYRGGMSIRGIARTFHHSRRKIREMLKEAYPNGYTRRRPAVCPVGDALRERVRGILKEDAGAPRKQCHTARQIYRRLSGEGYAGSERTIRRVVAEQRRVGRELYLPLVQDPGLRVEADFGEAEVDFPWGRTTAHLLVLSWSYSSCPFVMAFPTERTEAILEGVSSGLEFYGCVPKEVWWDNPRTVVGRIYRGRRRDPTTEWQRLANHYVFDPKFCLCGKGNEKPRAEGLVKYFRKRWLVPVPSFGSWEEFNAYLRECCLADRARRVGKRTVSIAEQWEEERAVAAPLPPYRYDACVREETRGDHQQLVVYDSVCYSVPSGYAFQPVTLKARVHEIEIVYRERTIARHARSYERGAKVLDPLHYLPTLERKPGALDHVECLRKWELPSVFTRLREDLERRWEGSSRGTREYIQVLRLHERFSTPAIAEAAGFCLERGCAGVDSIRLRLEQQLLSPPQEIPCLDLTSHPELAQVELPPVGLEHYNQLLDENMPAASHAEFHVSTPNEEPVQTAPWENPERYLPQTGGVQYERDFDFAVADVSEAVALAGDGP